MGRLTPGTLVKRHADNAYMPLIIGEIIQHAWSNDTYDMYLVKILLGDKEGEYDFWGDKYCHVVSGGDPTWEL